MSTEFSFIDGLIRGGLSKLGDDCAVLPKSKKNDLVVSADLLVEEIDFRRNWITPEQLGARALAVSLSDIAAMGGTPIWSMTSVGIPDEIWESDYVRLFYDGYLSLAKRFGVELIGGDISRTPDTIVIDSVVGGDVLRGRAILRSGAKPGDAIFVSGPLGGAAAGLQLLLEGVMQDTANDWQRALILRQLEPFPEVEKAKILMSTYAVTSMIDLSDGLSSDLRHLVNASRVGAVVIADEIPLDEELARFASSREERLRLAIDGGEDFRLLFTARRGKFLEAVRDLPKGSFFEIGEITANTDNVELISGGMSFVLEPNGWRHF